MYFEAKCDCGNPAHDAEVTFRKGYVHIRHPDGRVEKRWDYLYLDVIQQKTEGAEFVNVEFMFPPETARALLWWCVASYLPGFHRFYERWRFLCHYFETWRYRHSSRRREKK